MNARKSEYRWGILGTGWMAREFARELHLTRRARPVAVASRDVGRAEAFARSAGIPNAFDSYDALIRSGVSDVVYVAGTNDTHYETARACVECGIPVLVEKPICTCVSDLKCLMETAAARGTFCMEAMWTLFFPAIRTLKENLRPIGPIRRVEADFCVDLPYAPHHRLYDPKKGGGALLDIGIYLLTFARAIFGNETPEISADLTRAPSGTDDSGEIRLIYSNNRSARLRYSLRGALPQEARITGDAGKVVVSDFFHPSRIAVTPDDGAPFSTHYTYPFKGYHYEIEAVQRALDEGRTGCAEMPLDASLAVLSMMEKILGTTF